jgi:hypothetical protein
MAVGGLGGISSATGDPLIPGGGSKRTDCIVEFSASRVDDLEVGRGRVRCVDGNACDGDGRRDDSCTFSIAVCLNNTDPTLPACRPSDVASFEVRQKRSRVEPQLTAVQAAVGAVGLPAVEPRCSDAVELTVPVKVRRTKKRPGKLRVRTVAQTARGIRDRDRLVLLCDPAGPAPTNRAPHVEAAATPTRGQAPLTVTFTAAATDPDGDALSIAWDFGDRATASGTAVSHTYPVPGTFTAIVTATDAAGATAAAELTIAVAADLSVGQANRYPTRLAEGPAGKLYVSDAKVGSVFIYEASLNLVGELKDLDRPLGVAVDSEGNIYVGNDGRDNVEVYSATGARLFVIDTGNIRMPNDLALDRQGRVYVVDSLSDTVKVYDAAGRWLREIGWAGADDGELLFPVAVTVAYRPGAGGYEVGELYVADQDNARVQVFDLQGVFLRTYGSKVPAFSTDWHGRFVKLQSLTPRRGQLPEPRADSRCRHGCVPRLLRGFRHRRA